MAFTCKFVMHTSSSVQCLNDSSSPSDLEQSIAPWLMSGNTHVNNTAVVEFFLLSFTSSRLLYLPDTGSSSGAARGGWGRANLPPSFFAVPTVGRRWVGLLEEVSKWEELGSPTGQPCKFLALPSLSSPRGTQCLVCSMVSCRVGRRRARTKV